MSCLLWMHAWSPSLLQISDEQVVHALYPNKIDVAIIDFVVFFFLQIAAK